MIDKQNREQERRREGRGRFSWGTVSYNQGFQKAPTGHLQTEVREADSRTRETNGATQPENEDLRTTGQDTGAAPSPESQNTGSSVVKGKRKCLCQPLKQHDRERNGERKRKGRGDNSPLFCLFVLYWFYMDQEVSSHTGSKEDFTLSTAPNANIPRNHTFTQTDNLLLIQVSLNLVKLTHLLIQMCRKSCGMAMIGLSKKIEQSSPKQ